MDRSCRENALDRLTQYNLGSPTMAICTGEAENPGATRSTRLKALTVSI